MSDPSALSRAFLSSQPVAAARVVEELPVVDAAAFFTTCPPEIVAPVMVELHDEVAAGILVRLGDTDALKVLRSMPPNEIAFLLRLVDAAARARLLDGLPKRLAGQVRPYLGYPPDRLGAWTRSDMLTLDPEKAVSEALARVRAASVPPDDPLFLVGAGRRYRGAVHMRDILRAQPGRRLGGLVLDDLPPLYDRAPIGSVADLDIWAIHNRVPVVDRAGRFVGVLTEQALRRALDEAPAEAAPAETTDGGTLLYLGAGYVGALASALHVLLARRN